MEQKVSSKETPNQKSVYAEIKRSSDESKSIWAVSKDILDITNADPVHWGVATFINKPLYSIDEFSVTFRRDGNITSETRLEKINSEWNFVKPSNAQANKEKVLFFLNSLLSEKIKGFVHLPSEENNLQKAVNSYSKLFPRTQPVKLGPQDWAGFLFHVPSLDPWGSLLQKNTQV